MCPRINKLRVARKDLGIKKYEGLAPTSCCCEHTHVCCRISKLRLHARIRGLQGLGRPGAAASTHMCVSEKTTRSFKVAPKDQRLCGVGRRTAAVSIHMCVWQNHTSTQGLHQGSKRYESLADQLLLRAYTYVCQKQPVPGCTQGSQVTRDWPTNCENMSRQGCTQGPRDTGVWPTMCCCEHTRVCCRIYQFRVAPKCQGLQWFGRSVAAAGAHM